ncbi:MAG: hypothetical protein JNK37_19560 [Verrucomicrobiales bacterium]|nr:hypothetical protein [Verrucomicrobiales bacterium]
MAASPPFDLVSAHRWFSAGCFNGTWDLMDLPDRTHDQNEALLLSAHASLWHWRQRPDVTNHQLSIGYWLLSRAHATVGQVSEARRWADRCLAVSGDEPPFFLGYAHEACARAARLGGDQAAASRHLAAARGLLASVDDEEERQILERDLDALTA